MADRKIWRRLAALGLLLVAPVLGVMALAPRAAAQAVDGSAPDFSGVTTKAAARKLVREGRLVEIHLFPTELGGPDDPMNIAWITPEAADVRDLVIGTLTRFFKEGTIDRLEVIPEYRGGSVIPNSIAMTASHSGQEGSFGTIIEVW